MPPTSLPKLKELSEFVDEIANVRHDPRQPWVGQTAFAHKGGMHVHAIDRVARSYEHINPEAVGNFRRVLVSDMSGRTNILMKAQELGFKLEPDAPDTAGHHRPGQGTGGPRATNLRPPKASLALLIGRTLKHQANRRSSCEAITSPCAARQQESVCEATVSVRVDGKEAHTVAEGRRPGERARRRPARGAGRSSFPQLKNVALTDYKVRILEPRTGTARQDARADPVQRRQARVGHRRRERKHHRSQPAGAGGQHGIRAAGENDDGRMTNDEGIPNDE